ncbi:hypothetical protein [Cupriavidus sp. DL-D2]|uniref:hypothetical protein n=1 Tax=Cupriavidus sp. DL-D2 TaxID=3144974 RepID=UPI003215D61A
MEATATTPPNVMPLIGPDGWRSNYASALVPSDAALRYVMTPEVREHWIREGLIFLISTRLMTDRPHDLLQAVVDVYKDRSRARFTDERRAGIRAVPSPEPSA